MLNVKPILFLEDGQLFPAAKVRGKKKAVAKIVDLAKEYVGSDVMNYSFGIAHGDNLAYGEEIATCFHANIPAPLTECFFVVGATIGVNAGPDACGVCVMPKYETLLVD